MSRNMPDILSRICTRLYTLILRCRGAKTGRGSVLHHSTDVMNASRIMLGEDSTIYKNVSIYPDKSGYFIMGNRSHAAPYCYFLIADNRIEIGNDVAIGPFCAFFCHSNSPEGAGKVFSENYVDSDIIIGSNVFIGAHCTVLPGTIIPDRVVIGANSLVSGELESGFIYAGSPAKKIKSLN
ncbi:MAG: acyltransferase [Bacteroidetes bacterium]|nr:acyltransferase [Bacteroidota bacterium]